MRLPSLSKRHLEMTLDEFALEWGFKNNKYKGKNRDRRPFTIDYPHPRKPDPDTVADWLRYLAVSREEFLIWWHNK